MKIKEIRNFKINKIFQLRKISSRASAKKTTFLTPVSDIIYHLLLSSMHNLLLHIPIHHGTVMMNHVPPSIMELEDIGHIERPCIHVNICFHGNPSHVCQNPSTYIPNLKVQSLIPVEYELPALHYSIIPVTWIIVLLNSICPRQNGINSNEVKRMSI